MPPKKGKRATLKQKLKKLGELAGVSGGSSTPPSPPPSSPPARRKNAQPRRRVRTPSPSPPPADGDDDEVDHESGEDDREDEEHEVGEDGGEDEMHEGGEEGAEDEEHLSEDEGLRGLPLELDPSLAWEPPEEEGYVAPEERLEPRQTKQYRRGYTHLPKLKHWTYRNVVLVPAGKRYILILAFHYQNFIIIEIFITYILIVPFHYAARLRLATRIMRPPRPTRTSLEAY